MKTAHKRVLIACVAAVVGLLSWLYWPKAPQLAKSRPLGQENSSPSAPAIDRLTSTPASNASTNTAIPTAAEIRQRNEQQIKTSYLTPISVFGKVVDENGNPVPGATVEIGIADNPLKTGSKYTQTTDGNGLFSLSSRGIAFSLRAFKDGYYTTDKSTGHRNVVVPAEGDISQPTEDRPAILVLHKQGQTDPLIARSSGQIMVPNTGQAVNVDLAKGRIGQGDLQIASWVGDNSQKRYDWRYQLTVPNGGIIERKDRFDFEAPADGYQETAEIDMPATAQAWSIGTEREYFAKLSDGRYARFSIRFYPRRRNFVVLESYVNPAPGNRNLEFDPAKQIKAR